MKSSINVQKTAEFSMKLYFSQLAGDTFFLQHNAGSFLITKWMAVVVALPGPSMSWILDLFPSMVFPPDLGNTMRFFFLENSLLCG